MKRIELKEVKKLNEEMFGVLTRHNESVLKAIEKVKKVVGLDFHINPLPAFEIIRKEEGNYLDDGNTPTEGYEWIAYWAFSINHQPVNGFNYNSVSY
ncbi:MAG: hypothetical protein WC026_13350 [Hyphomicrobium sp.]|uniref:hypothetical protein n=1 Tax=Hyphomicrobium sp. TaxID=82 RepID=UPI0035644C7D